MNNAKTLYEREVKAYKSAYEENSKAYEDFSEDSEDAMDLGDAINTDISTLDANAEDTETKKSDLGQLILDKYDTKLQVTLDKTEAIKALNDLKNELEKIEIKVNTDGVTSVVKHASYDTAESTKRSQGNIQADLSSLNSSLQQINRHLSNHPANVNALVLFGLNHCPNEVFQSDWRGTKSYFSNIQNLLFLFDNH